ncbi:hypothetical protein P3T40_003440 [Paraburkholderia sp. EB58]|uniref:hypothetical protein n=1 Tax=Paraburkholderia sp. EB58 TaxID=3035125 RepID=UPI003D2444C4
MGKHANFDLYEKLARQTREQGDDLSEAERAAGWDDFEPRHVTLSDELHVPGIQRVRLGNERS